ncbi:FIMAH domain-containing protein [Kineococcus arenarius]|uniref:FIMAH domain-containing protein n=1 Tax=unclassified Kineococcus TaxID=2621656 RepID=UPI003D7ED46D
MDQTTPEHGAPIALPGECRRRGSRSPVTAPAGRNPCTAAARGPRLRLTATAGAFFLLAGGVAVVSPAAADDLVLGPQISHTGQAPTGYSVTFRIEDADATSMLIKGSWSFATTESVREDQQNTSPILPQDWTTGAFPLQSPNRPSENWPVATMTEESDGVWTYTVPLPGGVWDYQFYPDCTVGSISTCTAVTDPANPAWNTTDAGTTGSPAVFSQVYVPGDSAFGSQAPTWLAEDTDIAHGTLQDVSFTASYSSTGTDRMAVYTPPGYDPDREVPYPLIVMTHGGGEDEIAWSTRGRVQQIADNLIAAGEMQPAVIVMPSYSTSPTGYADAVVEEITPYALEHWNVSQDVAGRALTGNSAFGGATNEVLFENTSAFGYYGVWAPASGAPAVGVTGEDGAVTLNPAYTDPELPALLGLHIAVGSEDTGGDLRGSNVMIPTLTATTEREGLITAGVPFRYYEVPGGHTWAFWQQALHDFLTQTAFRTTTTEVSSSGGDLVAQVAAATAEPAVPTGTVQFIADGRPIGDPVPVQDGTATLTGSAADWSGTSVTARYEGDALYNSSTSDAARFTADPAALLEELSGRLERLRDAGEVTGRVGSLMSGHLSAAQRHLSHDRADLAAEQLRRFVERLDPHSRDGRVSPDADAQLRAAVEVVLTALQA